MRTLIVIDLQRDFLPGGALAVPEGDAVVPVLQRILDDFELVVATQDWHPAGHRSFASQHRGKSPGDVITLEGLEQILWPDHCIQGTPGAEFAPGVDPSRFHRIVHKGTDPGIDSYSGFFDNGHRRATGLGQYLEERGVSEVSILGLATDYCVKFTALDARELGFQVNLITDGCRGVELAPGDCERAIDSMRAAGVVMISRENLRS